MARGGVCVKGQQRQTMEDILLPFLLIEVTKFRICNRLAFRRLFLSMLSSVTQERVGSRVWIQRVIFMLLQFSRSSSVSYPQSQISSLRALGIRLAAYMKNERVNALCIEDLKLGSERRIN